MAKLKTIAVPLNPGARRGKRETLPAGPGDDALEVTAPPAALRRPARAVLTAPAHRYHVGERLRMSNGGYSVARAGAYCKVMGLLPYEGHGSLLYRVRSETEAYERIVTEADLVRA